MLLSYLKERKAQMFVEAVVVFPLALVISLVAINIFWYLDALAAFERISLDAVLMRAASPAGNQRLVDADQDIQKIIAEAMKDHKRVSIEVSSSAVGETEDLGYHFNLAAGLKEYSCGLRYEPWPRIIHISYADAAAPGFLLRVKKIVVDPYRSGVVV